MFPAQNWRKMRMTVNADEWIQYLRYTNMFICNMMRPLFDESILWYYIGYQ